ncbi:MAG: LLM class flavin-dependent oxidoreductase [Nocardioides sp.]|nr:LLM class flavin-dependent oxidoreductase [Nocardioides sp.]
MELIASLPADTPLQDVGAWARRVEALGFDTLHVSETVNDPFVTSTLALEQTQRLVVRTSMVVAFPRSPMVSAYSAWSLSRFSGGSFELGVASQVRGNIVGRYSAPWVEPVSQLRDYIASLRAIFASFQEGVPLVHDGPHYRFDRLQPYFNPGPLEHPAPSIWSGGVNERMCTLGGEVSDGFVCHPTASHPNFLDRRVLPAIEKGVDQSGRGDGGPRVVVAAKRLAGRTTDDVARARDAYRPDLAFLYSTPAYSRQLELLGFSDLAARLSAHAKAKNWAGLADCLTDELIQQLIPSGTYADLPLVLERWYAGRCDGLILNVPTERGRRDAHLRDLVEAVRDIATR